MANPNISQGLAEKAVPLLAAAAIGAYAVGLFFNRFTTKAGFTWQDRRFLSRSGIDPNHVLEPVRVPEI